MSTPGKTSTWSVIGELSALSAGVFALSFIYGFNEYKAFIDAVGVGWGGAILSPATYAMRSIKGFTLVAPYVVLAFAAAKYGFSDRFLRFLFVVGLAVGLGYMLLAIWLNRYGYLTRATPTADLISEWSQVARLVLGLYVAVVLAAITGPILTTQWRLIGGMLCLYVFLVVFPRITGEAEGVWVRTSQGLSLPYIEESGIKWFVVDYQVGSSLLIHYEHIDKPLVMYKAIEGSVIKYDYARKYVNEWDE